MWTRIAVAPCLAGALALATVTGCNKAGGGRDTVGAADQQADTSQVAMSNDTTQASGPRSEQAGAPDQQFLSQMSNHHEGLILLAGRAAKRGTGSVKTDASKLASKQRSEQQKMITMLKTDFNASAQPTVMPENKAMSDSLEQQKGDAYTHGFYQDVIAHHQEGIAMIDSFLPRLQQNSVRAMAEKMRKDQSREIQEFKSKAGHS